MDVWLFATTAAAFHYAQRIERSIENSANAASVRSTDLFDDALAPFSTPDRGVVLPRHQFPSVDFAKAPLIGLLFAAGWCPDCQQGVPLITSVISSPSNQTNDGDLRKLIEVYYVSSDTSKDEMTRFMPDVYRAVPYEQSEERTQLKRFFQVCAKKEMEAVGIVERKSGIPTLIVLDGTTGQMITSQGFEDCQGGRSPLEVLQGWKSKLALA